MFYSIYSTITLLKKRHNKHLSIYLYSSGDLLLNANHSPRSLSTLFHLSKLVQQVVSELVFTEPHIDPPAYVPAARLLRLWRLRFTPVFPTVSGIPPAQPWGFSPRFCSFSPVADLLDASPRRNVRADSFCWRTSVSSVIPLAPSATGMSCSNALPVELVRKKTLPILCSKALRRIIYEVQWNYIFAR